MAKTKQYVYIVQSSKETNVCKIGITDNYQRRLKDYNNMTGKSKDTVFKYLFVCEVKDMVKVENAIKKEFSTNRTEKNKEIYLYNEPWFNIYVDFIKRSQLYIKETLIKEDEKKTVTKIVKRNKPTLEERGTSKKEIMQKAKKVKNDEFYTRYEDIEKELNMYSIDIWKNKCVFCNCDDAVDNNEKNTSAFALFFLRNFKKLKLKKLICTHFAGKNNAGGQIDLFNQGSKGYIFTKEGFSYLNDYEKLKNYPKDYDGSFDHKLSLEILHNEADIVCTNPPFSRAKDYWKLIIGSGKSFLIVSGETNVKNQPYMSYFKEKKVWAGYNDLRWFLTPKKELTRAAAFWFTNFSIELRPKANNLKIIPLKNIPEKYKKYDDDNILLVDFCYIPSDYKKHFAVSTTPILSGLLEKGYDYVQEKEYVPYINGKRCFGRILVKKE